MISSIDLNTFKYDLFDRLSKKCKCDNASAMSKSSDSMKAKCKCALELELKVRLKKSCVPERFWEVKATDFEQKELYKTTIVPYVSNINKMLKNGCGLFFTGPNGTGKTQFMSFVAKQILFKTGYSCYYITAMQMMSNIHKFMNEKPVYGFDSKQEVFDDVLCNVDFLMLDELGKEKSTEFSSTHIERVLRTRLDNARPTIISSNLTIEELESKYDSTIKSIIYGTSEIKQTDFDDRRLSVYRKKVSGIYE